MSYYIEYCTFYKKNIILLRKILVLSIFVEIINL